MIDIIIGSDSDRRVADKCVALLKELGIEYRIQVASAHREPGKVREIIKNSDAKIFIAIAGLSAALPGFIASLTNKPVIGVPVSSCLGGLDALLSIVQLPTGTPVATVGIDNGENAGLLALRILALEDEKILEKLKKVQKRTR